MSHERTAKWASHQSLFLGEGVDDGRRWHGKCQLEVFLLFSLAMVEMGCFFGREGNKRKCHSPCEAVTCQLQLMGVVIQQPGEGWCLTTGVAPRVALF